MLEYPVDARATKNKKKIIHYHDEVIYMIYTRIVKVKSSF